MIGPSSGTTSMPCKTPCLGAYRNEGECESCPLALFCIEATIRNDGYYDSRAREEENWWEEIEQSIADAASVNALSR